ncbi:MAG TPA: hypothetical protein VGF93_07035 [Solirubrobacteraceae bacterium]|jgi:hypothetical protein
MSVSDRASALAPYAEKLVHNRDVHDAVQRAAVAGRDAYQLARGKRPAKRRRRWGLGVVVVTVAGAGAFVATNAAAREAVLGLVTNNRSK